jgi:hypothetical protein
MAASSNLCVPINTETKIIESAPEYTLKYDERNEGLSNMRSKQKNLWNVTYKSRFNEDNLNLNRKLD